MHLPVLGELVIVLAAAIAILYVCHRLRIPPVTGFLLTGIVIGPSGLGLIRNARNIDVLAEVGVVMLLEEFAEIIADAVAQYRQNKNVLPVIVEVPSKRGTRHPDVVGYYRQFSREFLGFDIVI